MVNGLCSDLCHLKVRLMIHALSKCCQAAVVCGLIMALLQLCALTWLKVMQQQHGLTCLPHLSLHSNCHLWVNGLPLTVSL